MNLQGVSYTMHVIENRYNINLNSKRVEVYLFDEPVPIQDAEAWESRLDRLGIRYALIEYKDRHGSLGYNLRLEKALEVNYY